MTTLYCYACTSPNQTSSQVIAGGHFNLPKGFVCGMYGRTLTLSFPRISFSRKLMTAWSLYFTLGLSWMILVFILGLMWQCIYLVIAKQDWEAITCQQQMISSIETLILHLAMRTFSGDQWVNETLSWQLTTPVIASGWILLLINIRLTPPGHLCIHQRPVIKEHNPTGAAYINTVCRSLHQIQSLYFSHHEGCCCSCCVLPVWLLWCLLAVATDIMVPSWSQCK